MKKMVDPARTYSERAAKRLNKLLEEEGYPQDLRERANALSRELSIDCQEALKLLSGITHWTFDDLKRVCKFFEREEGYFLNKNFNYDFPSDSRVVPSLDGGESIVIRFPNGYLKQGMELSPDINLYYLRAHQEMRRQFNPGSLLVCAEHDNVRIYTTEGDFYVIQTDESLEVMQCTEAQELLSRFAPLDNRIGTFTIRPPNAYIGEEKRSVVKFKVIASIEAV
jgi:hypothetical protein